MAPDLLTPVLVTLLAAQTRGFAPRQLHNNRPHHSSLHAERINTQIDLDSPKVATMDTLEANKKVYCRCWQSGTFPLCDGSHMAHNKETGDNVGPLILSVAKPTTEDTTANVKETTKDNEKTTGIVGKIKNLFKAPDDGLTWKERMAKAGLSVLLSYGWVSNMSYAVSLSLAWFGFSKKTGLSPLAPGQWKPFLAVYAGFYVFNNIVRPLRFAASMAVSTYFDNAVAFIEKKTKLSRKLSIGVLVFLVNICGTFAAMGLGVSIASTAAGVHIFPPKA